MVGLNYQASLYIYATWGIIKAIGDCLGGFIDTLIVVPWSSIALR